MKKFLMLSLALALFSCSKDDVLVNSQSEKQIKTVDSNIWYESPYNYFSLGYIENPTVEYSFINTTDVKFNITPYFGLAYNLPGYYIPSSFPILGLNNQIHGNYMSAKSIIVLPNDIEVIKATYAVPTDYQNDGEGYFVFEDSPYNFESSELLKRGKLFFIEISIDDSLVSGKVKIPMMYDFNSSNGLGSPWQSLGVVDGVFSDELIFNTNTREVCSTISSNGLVKDYLILEYNGKKFIVSSMMNTSGVYFKISEIY